MELKFDNIISMDKKFIINSILVTSLLFVFLPTNTFALATPSATSCAATGGTSKLIYNPDGNMDDTCVYFGGIQCTSYEFYKGGGCVSQRLLFGSLYWWPTRIIYLALIIFIVYKFTKSRTN